MRRCAIATAVSVLSLLIGATTADAVTLTVTSTSDSGAGSLRQTIAEASPGETIALPASTSPYLVTSGTIHVEKNLTIMGAGASSTVISGMGTAENGLEIGNANVTVDGLTLTGMGDIALDLTEGELTLSGVVVTGDGKETIDGGGISTSENTTLTVNASSIESNQGNEGGGVFIDGEATINNSTIANNVSQHGDGGGLQSRGTLTLSGDTIARNTGHSSGGGLFVEKQATIVNSTIVENQAMFGAGIESRGMLTLLNDTIARNQSGGPADGGGIAGTATATNTIIAENTDKEGAVDNCRDSLTSNGPNLENGSECKFSIGKANPVIGPLANNGGPTQTEKLLAGSAAIEAGTNTGCPTTDQRGVVRPVGPLCDIGAVEFAPPAATTGTATSITQSSATLNGVVNSLGLGGLSWHFQWGPSTSYGNQTPNTTSAAFGSEGVAATISGLPAGSTIHYQLVVSDSEGTSFGADQILQTAPSVPAAAPPAKCVVPRLRNLSLKKAKRALAKAHCTLGRVKQPKHLSRSQKKKLVVLKQSPAAAKALAAGARVQVTLGLPVKHHKHKA